MTQKKSRDKPLKRIKPVGHKEKRTSNLMHKIKAYGYADEISYDDLPEQDIFKRKYQT